MEKELIDFHSDYQKKLLIINFLAPCLIKSKEDVAKLRQLWLSELKAWHSPYKALLNCQNLTITPKDEKIELALKRFYKLLQALFLRKAVGFNFNLEKGHQSLPFEVVESEAEAMKSLGFKEKTSKLEFSDFRSLIQIENDFKNHVVELSFRETTNLDSKEKLTVLRSKLLNNLMQWHSGWNLLIDCQHFSLSEEYNEPLEHLIRVLKGFFLKTIVGYGVKASKAPYPFKVYRSRHRAVQVLEAQEEPSGEIANCSK